MIFEKIISTTIDSIDHTLLYASNLSHALLQHLRNIYVGRCFKHMLITEIPEIIEYSPAILNGERNIGAADFHITFRCVGVAYDRYEVITAKIVEIAANGNMVLSGQYVSTMLKNDARLNHYKINDVVPVRVLNQSAVPYRDVIGAPAIPFIPIMEFQPADVDIEKQIDVKEIDELYKAFNKLPNADKWLAVFEQPHKPLTDYKIVDIDKITGAGRIYRPVDMMGKSVCFKPADKNEKSEKSEKTDKKNDVIASIINDMRKHIMSLTVIATEYDFAEAKKSAWMRIYLGK